MDALPSLISVTTIACRGPAAPCPGGMEARPITSRTAFAVPLPASPFPAACRAGVRRSWAGGRDHLRQRSISPRPAAQPPAAGADRRSTGRGRPSALVGGLQLVRSHHPLNSGFSDVGRANSPIFGGDFVPFRLELAAPGTWREAAPLRHARLGPSATAYRGRPCRLPEAVRAGRRPALPRQAPLARIRAAVPLEIGLQQRCCVFAQAPAPTGPAIDSPQELRAAAPPPRDSSASWREKLPYP